VAILGKWFAAFFTQLVFKYSVIQRQLIFGLSSAHAAATLAVILVGYKAGILDENILNGTIILILITCIVASFATERAAKKMVVNVIDESDELQVSKSLNERIMIPIANTLNMPKILDFAVYIKDKKSENPITILTVVPNDVEAERNITKAKQSFENTLKDLAASETNAEVIATIDYNISSGISRTAREISADIIILGWPQKTGFFDKLMGDKMESILDNTEKTLFISDFEIPLINHKRIFAVVPPRAENEEGFISWMLKLSKLANELSIPFYMNCNKETQEAIVKLARKNKTIPLIIFSEFSDWDDFFVLSKHINDTDLIVLVSARKGSVSYFNQLDKLPSKLEKHFPLVSKIIVYP
jgi:hypothetical protein